MRLKNIIYYYLLFFSATLNSKFMEEIFVLTHLLLEVSQKAKFLLMNIFYTPNNLTNLG